MPTPPPPPPHTGLHIALLKSPLLCPRSAGERLAGSIVSLPGVTWLATVTAGWGTLQVARVSEGRQAAAGEAP